MVHLEGPDEQLDAWMDFGASPRGSIAIDRASRTHAWMEGRDHVLPDDIRAAIEAHARWCFPEEACGLLALDSSGSLRMAYCLTNAAASAERFTVHPVEHYRAIEHAERHGWHIGGDFHSHPRSPAVPSASDVDLSCLSKRANSVMYLFWMATN